MAYMDIRMSRGLTSLVSKVSMASAVARLQIQSALANIEELMPILVIPLYSLASLAILLNAGRADLAPYALIASFLMTVTQMILFVAGDILYNEYEAGLLELHLAAPSSYVVVVYLRSVVISIISLIGLIESHTLASTVFDLNIPIQHPAVFFLTLMLTLLCAAHHGLLLSAALSTTVTPRTYQNVISGPLFLVGGILVPTTYLPDWINFFSPLVFLSWASDLLRMCYAAELPSSYKENLFALVVIALISGALACVMYRRRTQYLVDGSKGLE